MRIDLLKILLNDHLGGAVAGIDIARRCRDRHPGSPVARTLEAVVPQIEEDKAVLEDLIIAVGAKPSTTKEALGWIGEQFIQGRLAAINVRDDAAGIVFELETLLMGVRGKELMWEALEAIQGSHPALTRFDFGRLRARAIEQQMQLAEHHVQAAREAFVQD